MANYRLSQDFWETSGVYDIEQGKTQREINQSTTANNEPKTVTGNVATFNGGGDGVPVKSLVVDIEPIQTGTGDPTPTNVRPITGWTGVNISAASKNIFNSTIVQFTDNKYIDADGNVATHSSYKLSDYMPINNETVYTVTIEKTDPGTVAAYISFFDANREFIERQVIIPSSGAAVTVHSTTVTSPLNAKWCRVHCGKLIMNLLQIEEGSTATTVVPAEQAYSVTFPDSTTIYHGTATFNNDGTVTVVDDYDWMAWNGDGKFVRNDGAEPAGSGNLGNNYVYFSANDSNTGVTAHEGKCNIYNQATVAGGSGNPAFDVVRSTGNSRIQIRDTSIPGWSTATTNTGLIEAVRTYFDTLYANGTVVTIIWEITTPRTYTIPLDEFITTHLGQNTIWADAGAVTVEYGAYLTVIEDQLGNKIPKTMLAPIEKTTTASKAYSVNELFIMGDKLYIATASIASGATFTVGTNCDETTLGEQIAALLNA